ncbi:hypothetical protein D2V17_16735 [Aurantiacibacter xanthus]|uniref:Mor transcription activator domain-containing protein n=1 Tax=Aurantiacibacter xanthus TaxID=1784712 RepID=A0A3A1P024_9SPHN|nr:Mor transcription activator family protein [Aurantiacibacter xanthus]RIV81782.1 hypothetical protein D2V17_16735 [Aurantiacibacter xanthus]
MATPNSFREIADVIGEDNAVRLIEALPTYRERSGRCWSERALLYVPKRISPDHHLAKILGQELADKLAEGFGGEMLKPANARIARRIVRDKLIRRRADDGGASIPDLSRAFHLTERQIRNILRRREVVGHQF